MKLTYVHSQPASLSKYKRAEVVNCQKVDNKGLPFSAENVSQSSRNISFCGAPTPFLKSTYNDIKSFYKGYRESLGEVSLKDIIKMTDNISKDTGHSRKEVLSVMQKMTQFANLRSTADIAKILEKHRISYIGNSNYSLEISENAYMPIDSKEIHDVVHDRIGLHRALTYLIDYKNFGSLERVGKVKTAYILDEQKVSQLEYLKDKDPVKFKQFKGLSDIKFFTVSGWDGGITFVDRTKNLEEETRKVLKYADEKNIPLEKAVDAPLMERIKKVGISPIVISRDGMPTEHCVYRQMAPESMTESELFNLIDANASERTDGIVPLLRVKDNSVKYLKKNLTIFTPETLSASVRDMHKRVLENAEKRGFLPDDILYVEPEPVKSNSLLTYMYKKINNISDDKFANVVEIKNRRVNPEGKLAVFIDDCTITGESLKGAVATSKKVFPKNQQKLFACLCGTTDAMDFFERKYGNEVIINNFIEHVPTYKKRLTSIRLENAVGGPDYGEGEATCLILPYMSPDNNTELASNIALLHNATYRLSNPLTTRYFRDSHKRITDKDAYIPMRTLRHEGIKNYTSLVDRIARKAFKLTGSEPVITNESFSEIKKANPRKWTDYFKPSVIEEFVEDFFLPNLL